MYSLVKLFLFVAILSSATAQLSDNDIVAVNRLIETRIDTLKRNFDTEFSSNIEDIVDKFLDELNIGEEFENQTGISIGAVIAILVVIIIIPNLIITVLIVLCCFCCCRRSIQGSQKDPFAGQKPNSTAAPISRAPVKEFNPAPSTHSSQKQHNPIPSVQTPPPTPVRPSTSEYLSSAPRETSQQSSGMWPWGGSNANNQGQREGHNNDNYKPEW